VGCWTASGGVVEANGDDCIVVVVIAVDVLADVVAAAAGAGL
jgi:hypothetical protein